MENIEKKPKRNVVRSPGYPMISLQEAIQKANIFWEKDRNNIIPIEAAYKHLGYISKAGYAARIMAALKKFDLINETKSGIKLTEAAVDLFISDKGSDRYIETVKKLALKPSIYEKILNECNGEVPSDDTLKYKLIKEHSFNAKSVDDFIVTFRETMEFAGLTGETPMQRTASLDPRTFVDDESTDLRTGILRHNGGRDIEKLPVMKGTIYPIPLSKRNQAAIAFETLPIEKKDIIAIKKWLELFESSLTDSDEDNEH
ncbi:MAG: hypothetical protein A4E64_00108 [Syntrophorhabdus sp. PtaU1.Bin058]|nr:MAG: hypothetical protein A4E64_00108 [Syntrophorhabdus sp. PtaU1.Bin058]